MILNDAVLTGPLSLGQDLTWNGENVLSDLCLYTEDSTEESPVFDLRLQLEAIVNSAAVKLFMYSRNRWKVACVESNSSIQGFLSELFNQGINLSGITKKALLIQAHLEQEQARELYPFEYSSTTLIIYGELVDSNALFLYAQPLYNDMDFEPIYEPAYSKVTSTNGSQNPFIGEGEEEQQILDQIFGIDAEDEEGRENQYSRFNAQLKLPLNRLSEIEIIKKINCVVDDNSPRDLMLEAKIAQVAKKQLIKQSRRSAVVATPPAPASIQQTTKTHSRISKSKPSKYKAPSSSQASSSRHHNTTNMPSSQPSTPTGGKTLLVQNKEITRKLIKDTIMTNGNYDTQTAQLIYSSIKHLYGKELNSHIPVNEERLLCLIKMHKNFYSNSEDVINTWRSE